MRRYMLQLEVKLVEMPDAPEPITVEAGQDPMQILASMANKVTMPVAGYGISPYMQPTGIDLRKQVMVSIANFQDLAKVLGQFEELASEIEVQKIA